MRVYDTTDIQIDVAEATNLVTTSAYQAIQFEGPLLAITGYADETGDVEYNRRLSLARARAVAAELSSFSPVINGAGEDTILYPNDTPEGRFYSRSVRITVLPAISRLGR